MESLAAASPHVNQLPPGVFLDVWSFLDSRSLPNVGFVCRHWWELWSPICREGPFLQASLSWTREQIVNAALRLPEKELLENGDLRSALQSLDVDVAMRILRRRSPIHPLVAGQDKFRRSADGQTLVPAAHRNYTMLAPVIQVVALVNHLPRPTSYVINGVKHWALVLPTSASFDIESRLRPHTFKLREHALVLAAAIGDELPQVTRERVYRSPDTWAKITPRVIAMLAAFQSEGMLPARLPLFTYSTGRLTTFEAHWPSVEAHVAVLKERFRADINAPRFGSGMNGLHEACGAVDVADVCPELIELLCRQGASMQFPTAKDIEKFPAGTTALEILGVRLADLEADLFAQYELPHDTPGIIESRARMAERIAKVKDILAASLPTT